MMRRHVMHGLAWLLPFLSMGLHAQALRDPTLAPPEANAGPASAATGGPGADAAAVIVRDGKPYLVAGTRLYAPGQKMGTTRVERITETEVWLRDATGLRKLPRFSGVQRRVAAPAPGCAPARPAGVVVKTSPTAPAKSTTAPAKRRAQSPSSAQASAASSNAPPIAACDGAQP